MSGRLKASSEPSSFTGASSAASVERDQDQGVGSVLHVPLAVAIVLVLVYPFLLIPLGFYLPAELKRLRRLVPAVR